MHPFPPSPAFTRMIASSINIRLPIHFSVCKGNAADLRSFHSEAVESQALRKLLAFLQVLASLAGLPAHDDVLRTDMTPEKLLAISATIFVCALGAIVLMQLFTGRINLRGLLAAKDGSTSISPERVQLLIL